MTKKINLNALPDKGAKIIHQIENLKLEIGNLDEKITRGEGIVAKEKALQANQPTKEPASSGQVSLLTGQV